MSDLDDANRELRDGEVEAVRSDGESFVAEISVSKLTDQPGVVLRYQPARRNGSQEWRTRASRKRGAIPGTGRKCTGSHRCLSTSTIIDSPMQTTSPASCSIWIMTKCSRVGPEAVSPKLQPDGVPSFGVRRGYVDQALAGEHPIFEWTHMDSAGREIPCEVRFSRLPSDERRLIRVSVTDISERKRTEALSVAQNEVLEMIASGAPHDKTLRAICRFVEQIGDGFRAAIMKLDAKRRTLTLAEAPSLPEPFKYQHRICAGCGRTA